jgi:hypothetical protein
MARAQTTIVFQDGTFAPSDWLLPSAYVWTHGNGGRTRAQQMPSGGNPAEYRLITDTVSPAPPSDYSGVIGFHQRVGATYDPSSQGAIIFVDYAEDSIQFGGGGGGGQATGPALVQGGTLFFAPGLVTPEYVWTHKTLMSLGAASFVDVATSLLHPDFGPTGGPIEFGFFRGNSNTTQGTGYIVSAGIDNWIVALHISTGLVFCLGDGSAATCPCLNSGALGHGCQNSLLTGGALLSVAGGANISADTLVLSSSNELPTAPSIVSPVPFGDGIRCIGGNLKRLYVHAAVGGIVTAPQGGDVSVSARSTALGDPLSQGMTRFYQVYYRDPSLAFCPAPQGNTFNVSNALAVTWGG